MRQLGGAMIEAARRGTMLDVPLPAVVSTVVA
jgi:hypothetical protein